MLPEEGPLHGAAGVGEVADPELDHVLPGSDPGRQRQQLVGERAGVPGARDALGAPPTPPQAQAGGGGGGEGRSEIQLGEPPTPPQAQAGGGGRSCQTPPQAQAEGEGREGQRYSWESHRHRRRHRLGVQGEGRSEVYRPPTPPHAQTEGVREGRSEVYSWVRYRHRRRHRLRVQGRSGQRPPTPSPRRRHRLGARGAGRQRCYIQQLSIYHHCPRTNALGSSAPLTWCPGPGHVQPDN